MPPFRMPFTSRRPVTNEPTSDENARPTSMDGLISSPYRDKPSLALGLKEKRAEPNEFKLSSVNDSGEYLPPSPTEKESFWSKAKSPTSTISNHRQCFNDNEPFSISRESFESYRRSFDISGRSPILQADSFTSRSSLDSRAPTRYPTRSTFSSSTFEAPTKEEEDFEDVKLTEDNKPQQPKKKSFLSRFGDSNGENVPSKEDGKHHFHIIPGRKRGQSGTGSELKDIPRPQSNGKAEVTVR
ncbi:uncharacterized protein PV06_02105 [Exophiala oligosperma]|uniref:Uncharacterized protein n=1 Tax=Exophiala oligosperma TaxID=215243 RepID=A0A0D2DTI5_9EURO|nr:uncharacterized protein PV06_02105 [Exophiala oligosperma]KIW46433.1 hypothetical protein PV06_02105 [Exophiala oligosperma]